MIRHIVMWKLDDSYSVDEKKKFFSEFGEKLLSLEGQIDQLKSISIKLNSDTAPDSNFDMLLDTSFNSFEDLSTYANHPKHTEVLEFSKKYKKERSCVDYEY